MNSISDKIKSGSRAFLFTEYKYLSIWVLVMFGILLIVYSIDPPSNDKTDGIRYAASFFVGATLSAMAGWYGMVVATDANVRTTQAAQEHGLAVALRVAFAGGAVMGFLVVGFGLFGLSGMYWLMTMGYGDEKLERRLAMAADVITAFGFGASSIALFARVAGGIYTKAADVGADLAGKIELGIPEDDPRNPAVIADNVGDNVGDVAGMGADLFESFVRSSEKWTMMDATQWILTSFFHGALHYRLGLLLLQSLWGAKTLPWSCCPFGFLALGFWPPSLAFLPLVHTMEPIKDN